MVRRARASAKVSVWSAVVGRLDRGFVVGSVEMTALRDGQVVTDENKGCECRVQSTYVCGMLGDAWRLLRQPSNYTRRLCRVSLTVGRALLTRAVTVAGQLPRWCREGSRHRQGLRHGTAGMFGSESDALYGRVGSCLCL